ncbi:MAG: hypothetical protein WCL06_15070 [Bacteroidota bacterium]
METIDITTQQKEFLPEAGSALTFSIWGNAVALLYAIPFFGFLCCVTGIVLSIVGLIKGRRGMELYKVDKQKYHGGSFVKTLIAFILGILGIVQGAMLSIIGIFYTMMIMSGNMHHLFRF